MSVSGASKGDMTADDVMLLDSEGKPLDDRKPSAEALLHLVLYRVRQTANAVLHTHSATGVTLTRAMKEATLITFDSHEILKAFPGITTHDTRVAIPIFDNTQDMQALAVHVGTVLRPSPQTPAFLIRGHGLYSWGTTMAEARRVIEATEFLLECEYKTLCLNAGKAA